MATIAPTADPWPRRGQITPYSIATMPTPPVRDTTTPRWGIPAIILPGADGTPTRASYAPHGGIASNPPICQHPNRPESRPTRSARLCYIISNQRFAPMPEGLLDYIPTNPTGSGFTVLMEQIWDGELTQFYPSANDAQRVARLCGAKRLYSNTAPDGTKGNTWQFPNGDRIVIACHGGAIRQVKRRTIAGLC